MVIVTSKLSQESKDYLQDILTIYGMINDISTIEVEDESPSNPVYQDLRLQSEDILILGIGIARSYLNREITSLRSVRSRVIPYDNHNVFVTYSVDYIRKNLDLESNIYKDIEFVARYLRGELVSIDTKKLRVVTDYFDFKREILRPEYQHSTICAYDIETNAVDTRMAGFAIVGFSIASDNGIDGMYVSRESLDFKMSDYEWSRVVELAKYYLKTRDRIVVHNCMYEIPATIHAWNYNLSSQVEDTLAKARLIRGGANSSASLKDSCITMLGYPDWDTDLGVYKSGFMSLIKNIKSSAGSLEKFKSTQLLNYCDDLQFETSKVKVKQYEDISAMLETIEEYYEGDEFYKLIDILRSKILEIVDNPYWNGIFSYGYIPLRIIGKYGAMDSVGTIDLNNHFDKILEEESEQLGIDLQKGYKYTLRQFLVGSSLEMNGLHWDDELAQSESNWCSENMVKSLKHLINSEFLADVKYEYFKDKYFNIFKEHHLDKISHLYPEMRIMKSCIKYFSPTMEDWKKVTWKNLLDDVNSKLGYDILDREFKDEILEMADREIESYTEYKDLKAIYNPGSNTDKAKDIMNRILVTDDIKVAHLLNKLNVEIGDEDFDISNITKSDRPIYQVLLDCKEENNKINKYRELADRVEDRMLDEQLNEEFEALEDEVKVLTYNTSKDTIQRFVEALRETNLSGRNLIKSVQESLSYRLDSLAESKIVELANYYQIAGVDINDFSTWTDRFKFLINFRMYKKCAKMKSTYIDGNRVGRGQVYTVDKNEYAKGENGVIVPRLRTYTKDITENETYVMQSSYNVAGADTLRWRSGLHCLHGSTKIKLADSRDITVEDLHREFTSGVDNYVYSIGNNGMIIDKIRDVYISRHTSEFYKITLDNEESILITPNHKLVLEDGTYIRADELKVGDRLYPVLQECRYHVKSIEVVYTGNPEPAYSVSIHSDNPTYSLSCGIMSKNTIPSDSTIKNIYNSRFKGGCIIAPDFCLHGDTKIRLANGTSPKIKDLVGLDEFYVYSYDTDLGEYKIGRAYDCREVRKSNDMVKLTLDTGQEVLCTSNHRFYDMRKECMVEVKDMSVGDSLLPIVFGEYSAHGVFHKGRECIIDPITHTQILTHFLADEYNIENNIYDESCGTDRHHIDRDKSNNDPRNIRRLTRSEHMKEHIGDKLNDPSYMKQLSDNTKKQWQNPEYRVKMVNVAKTVGKSNLLKSNSDPVAIANRSKGKLLNKIRKIEESLLDLYSRGIVPSEYLWNNLMRFIHVDDIERRGTLVKNIIEIYGSFPKFILSMSEKYEFSKYYLDAITFKAFFESRCTSRILGRIYRSYSLIKKYKYTMSTLGEWSDSVSRLKSEGVLGKFDGVTESTIIEIFRNYDNMYKYLAYNHKVAKIEYLNLEDEPVYCFTVDKYHNFFLDCGILSSNSQLELRCVAGLSQCTPMIEAFKNGADIHMNNAMQIYRKPAEEVTPAERRHAKMASFAILYGASADGFGDDFLNGDRALAHQIYDSFFSAFPQIKTWISEKHEEMRRTGKVTTIMGTYIKVSPSNFGTGKGAEGKALRASQNYPVQSSGSYMGGNVLYEVNKYMNEHNMKSKCIHFIHDSIEIDIHPDEFLQIASVILPLMNKYPLEEFGIPTKADLVVGPSLGQEMECKSIEVSDDFNEGTFEIEGYLEDFDQLIGSWREVYKLVEYEDIEEPTEEVESWSQFFVSKRAVNRYYGQSRTKIKRKIHIIIK